jgi:hypothetical protein
MRKLDQAIPQYTIHTSEQNSQYYSLKEMRIDDLPISLNKADCAVEYFPGRAEGIVTTQMENELAKALFQKNYYISNEDGHLNLVTSFLKCDENRFRIDCQMQVSLIRNSQPMISATFPIWVSKANKSKPDFGLAFGRAIDKSVIAFVASNLMPCH